MTEALSTSSASRRFDSLVFDIGKVLVDFDPIRALSRLADGSCRSAQDLLLRLQTSDIHVRSETGVINSEQFYREITQLLELRLGFQEFQAIWTDIFPADPILDRTFLRRFKPDYRLLVLSNVNAMSMEYLKSRFAIFDLFDRLVVSYEVGFMKPDQRIYEAAMEAAGTTAGRIFYVDDVAENVNAARQLGWTAVVFTGREQLEADLARYGVRPA